MSRRHRFYQPETPRVGVQEIALAVPLRHVPAVLDAPKLRWCDRLVNYDGLFWRCSCGAGGRVPVSADGIPSGPEGFRHLAGGEPC